MSPHEIAELAFVSVYAKKASLGKSAMPRGLGNVPTGAGPEQMYQALQMLSQARILADPSESLRRHGVQRNDFEQIAKSLAADQGERYDFDAYRANPKLRAILGGIAGAAGAGGLGYLKDIPTALGGAALGGAAGAGVGYHTAVEHNKKLLATAKVLKDYGLLKPQYLRQALPLLQRPPQS